MAAAGDQSGSNPTIVTMVESKPAAGEEEMKAYDKAHLTGQGTRAQEAVDVPQQQTEATSSFQAMGQKIDKVSHCRLLWACRMLLG